VILLLMAATSHDFWLRNLTPPVWKLLHMMVYVAYASLVGHVTLGLLQSEMSPLLAIATGCGLITVVGLHVAAASRENKVDSAHSAPSNTEFVDACTVESIPEKCARVVSIRGERVAIFKYDGKVSAISKRLPSPKWAFGRRQDHRWMRDLPVAWLSVSAGNRSVSAALHGENRDLQDSDC